MATISLCMIVKDEEAVLARCLESIQDVVDEIIIVDTGSTDKTREIAASFTDHVLTFPWVDDFSAARNFAFDHATMDYQMWLDADDVLPPEEAAKLLALKETLAPTVDIVTMKYITHFDENGNPLHLSFRERLLKRAKGYRWQDPVHECIPLLGEVQHSDITIHHRKVATERDSNRNLRIYEALAESGKPMSARQIYYYARELRDHGLWERAVAEFMRFLDGGLGWVEDNIAACHALGMCYRALNRHDESIQALLRGFTYGSPRAEIVCEIAYHYKNQGQHAVAADWFIAALGLHEPPNAVFSLPAYWGYIPHIELSVCCYQLGDIEKAIAHNRMAGECKPGNETVAQNAQFFESVLNGQVH